MAVIMAPGFNKPIYNGTHGNLSLSVNSMKLKAVAASTEIKFHHVPIGTKYSAIRVSNETLGSGVTLDVVIRDSEGNDVKVVSARTGNTEGSEIYPVIPAYVGDEGPSEVVLIVKGAAATGTVYVGLEYVSEGY